MEVPNSQPSVLSFRSVTKLWSSIQATRTSSIDNKFNVSMSNRHTTKPSIISTLTVNLLSPIMGLTQNKVGISNFNNNNKNINNSNNGCRDDPSSLGDNVRLDSHRVRMIKPYFAYSTIVSHSLSDYLDGTGRAKVGQNYILYDKGLQYFTWFFCIRNLLLTFVDDVQIRGWLGETSFERPQRQMLMVYTILSVYIVMIIKNMVNAPNHKNWLTWLAPFQILRGESTTCSFVLNGRMLDSWYKYTLWLWRLYFLLSFYIIANIVVFFVIILRFRWKADDQDNLFNYMQIFWTIVSILWTYLAVTLMLVYFVYFNSLCYYFHLRYQKVNNDIETIITQRFKPNDRVALLYQILVEHNDLCLKVTEYNQFWAKYLMSTYFYMISLVCFTAFQAFFTTNTIYVRFVMLMIFIVSAFIITRISISAAILSNEAHAPYNRLIRVTFEKYPIELQIQLRMFIQRTSGPTIGFYCLDVFEITYTTYASILAALGQNFLLIVDFVRSYAEVGKEYEMDDSLSLSSVFNTTLDVLDEMTGSHLSESFSNHSLMSIIQQY